MEIFRSMKFLLLGKKQDLCDHIFVDHLPKLFILVLPHGSTKYIAMCLIRTERQVLCLANIVPQRTENYSTTQVADGVPSMCSKNFHRNYVEDLVCTSKSIMLMRNITQSM